VSLHAVMRRPPRKGEKVLVIGAGVIGLNVIQSARLMGPGSVIHVLEKVPFKKELALKMGADQVLDGDPYDAAARATGAHSYRGPLGNRVLMGGFDLVYDCVGYSATIHDSLRWLKARGDYVMIGNQLSPVTFDQTPVWNQEITMRGVNAHGCETYEGKKVSTFDLAIRLITQGKLRVDGFVTHRFPLAEYKKAFGLIRKGNERIIKVVLVID